MTLLSAIGQDHAQDGREAGARAARAALVQLGRIPPSLALVAASFDYPIQSVTSGVSEQLGDTPLLGFSVRAAYTPAGLGQHSVTVAVLAGNEFQARAGWWPGINDQNTLPGSIGQGRGENASLISPLQRMLQALPLEAESSLLFIADGLCSDDASLLGPLGTAVPRLGTHTRLAGCLSPGDPRLQRSAQIGGFESGSAGLAAARITGKLSLGVGVAHGWSPVGVFFRVSGSQDRWIDSLDGKPAAETYTHLFGKEPRAWLQPPLNDMVRLYPLGIEYDGASLPCSKDCPYLVRMPLRFEKDGRLRMASSVPQNSFAHLLVSSAGSCIESARAAVRAAQEALVQAAGTAKPVLAVAWVDASYHKLLEAQPGSEFRAIQDYLGPEVPLFGAYTFGQVACLPPQGLPELLNGHAQVLLFA